VLLRNVGTCVPNYTKSTKATIELKKVYSFVSCNELCKPEQ